ncbi:MAG: FAD-binding protein [Candidatus Aminicenantes bacterium]|nr:MAG: FAD-binding protein [Candidatus Aminicenantes bacterium]
MKVKLTVDGQQIEAGKGQTILAAALAAGIYIPHLCYHPDLPSFEATPPVEVCYRGPNAYRTDSKDKKYEGCGLCLVKIKDKEEPVLSCLTQVEEGLEVLTTTEQIEALRQKNLVSVFTHHPHACLTCAQKEGCSLTQCSTNVPEEERCCPQFDFCELRKVAEHIGLKEDITRYVHRQLYTEEDKPLFIRDYNLCIGCLRCVRVCGEVIGANALGYVVVGNEIIVGTTQSSLEESCCRYCGVCVEVCPTGALSDKELKAGDRRTALVPCVARCPVEMQIPSYVIFTAQGKYDEARKVIGESVPLAVSLGYICHHPCEDECRRKELNQTVAICDLKRFALQANESRGQVQKEKQTGKRVAIVGSGPAGLVAAYFLAKFGHSVTVYEAQSEPGGMLRWAIPEYRLPRSVISQEIEDIKAMGVEILTNTPIKSKNFLEDLRIEAGDALFLATGAQESKKINVEGLSLDGVYWGLEFLREAKEGRKKELGGKVVVIGGGNVAFDVAMIALRLGASRVELACLEKREEMPAFPWEIQEAEEEGVVIYPGWGPKKIEGDGNQVKGVELQSCTSVFDEKGNFCPAFDTSQKKFLEADTVILAVGQSPDFSFLPPDLGIQLTEEGSIKINPKTLETNIPGIFAGGEAVSGPASAVEAMAMGRKAADSIDKFLGGKGLADRPSALKDEKKGSLWIGEEKDFSSKQRVSMPVSSVSERLRSFDLIQLGYREEEARKEASRCLRCDLRFRLSPVILPPEKWLEFSPEVVSHVSDSEGAFQLLDEEKNIIYIAGTPNLKQSLQEQLSSNQKAQFFIYEEDPMYTKRESELIQQFLQKHGHLPPQNEDVEDLF